MFALAFCWVIFFYSVRVVHFSDPFIFSESCHGSISILWNLEAFINILRFIYGCSLDVTPQNFIILYEVDNYIISYFC